MNSQLLLDAQPPKAIQQLADPQDARREFNKTFKTYSIIVQKPLKFIHSQQTTIFQILWLPSSTITFTFETPALKRIQLQFGEFPTSSKLNCQKIRFSPPKNVFLQIQFDNSLTNSCQKLKEIQVAGCELLKICSSNQIFMQTIFLNQNTQNQTAATEDKVAMALITVPRLFIGSKQVEDLLAGRQEYFDAQGERLKEIQPPQTQQTLQNEGKNAKIEAKPKIDPKNQQSPQKQVQKKEPPKKKKKITSAAEFQQTSGPESSGDYDFELPDLNLKIFQVTYSQFQFQEEIGQEPGVKTLTPTKIQGQKMRRQKLIGEKRVFPGQNVVDWSQFEVQSENFEEKEVENEIKKKVVEISDVELSENDFGDLTVTKIGKMDYQNFEEWKQSGEIVLKTYLVEGLSQKEKLEVKRGVLAGNIQLEDQKQAHKFDLVWDLVQKQYFELDDSDDE